MRPSISSGKSIEMKNEGLSLTTSVSSLDVTGAGGDATNIGDDVTLNIPGGTGAVIVRNEVPSGDINDVNDTYNLAHTPLNGISLTRNGQKMKPGAGEDYVLTGTQIVYAVPLAVGENHLADYEY